MNRKFISKSNRILRKILNSKDNLDIVQNFIESLLKIKIKEIQLNPYLEKKAKYLPEEDNFGIVDVRVKLLDNEELNIGIQFIDGYYIQNKMLLYYAQIHSNQLEYDDRRKIAKTVTINLLDFNYFDSKEYHKKVVVKPNKDEGIVDNNIELHVFELPKFKNRNSNKSNHEEAWMTYLCGEKDNSFNMVVEKFDKINKLDRLLNKYWENEKME